MKTWTFLAEYSVKRICTISANTEEEAKAFFNEGEWEEGEAVDFTLQDTSEPKWDDYIE